jgi:hypothetical protein
MKEGYHLEDLDVDGMIIFKINLKQDGCKDVNWIDLARDRDI